MTDTANVVPLTRPASAKARLRNAVDSLREEDATIVLDVLSDALKAEAKVTTYADDSRRYAAKDRVAVLRAMMARVK